MMFVCQVQCLTAFSYMLVEKYAETFHKFACSDVSY